MKKLTALILVLAFALALVGCGNGQCDVAGKIYTYEQDGAGGDFTITLHEDGTFVYYEGMFSSYIGMGTWSVDGSVLTLRDDDTVGYPFVNFFRLQGDALEFMEQDSSNFLYVKVKDGEVFYGSPIPDDAP